MQQIGYSSAVRGLLVSPPTPPRIDESIRERLAACPYASRFNDITWQVEEGHLTLRGSVPSYYLKQVLQTVLRDIQPIRRISNLVDVR
jgi:hypothetical protein